jgi:PiT family inorganic phosphate transporter
VITLPAAAVVGALATWLASTSAFGLVLVAVLALAGGLTFYVLAKRKPISHEDITTESGPAEQIEPQPTGATN